MALLENLIKRSNNVCELCSSNESLKSFTVYPHSDESVEHNILICSLCNEQIDNPVTIDVNHWRCLNDSIWNEFTPVKVVSYRVLDRLINSGECWAQDLQDMMYMEETDVNWAKEGLAIEGASGVLHKDSNGVVINTGDNVVLIKDLNVKGAGFTAKRGTSVRNLRLDPDNENHIEGRVNGQMIVILTQYVKK